jgi:hypothetical protein
MSVILDKLRAQHMSQAAAHIKGRQDYREGVVVGDNPFDENTREHRDWMAGWAAAGMEAQHGNVQKRGVASTG